MTKFQKPINNLRRKSEKFAYCYHYDDIVSYGLAQSDNIKLR